MGLLINWKKVLRKREKKDHSMEKMDKKYNCMDAVPYVALLQVVHHKRIAELFSSMRDPQALRLFGWKFRLKG